MIKNKKTFIGIFVATLFCVMLPTSNANAGFNTGSQDSGRHSDANNNVSGVAATCANNYYTGACGNERGGMVFTIEQRGTVIPGNGKALPTVTVDGPNHMPYYVVIRYVNTKTGELGPVANMNMANLANAKIWDGLSGHENTITFQEALNIWGMTYQIALLENNGDVTKYGLLALLMKSDLAMFEYITEEDLLSIDTPTTPTPRIPRVPPYCPFHLRYGTTTSESAVINISGRGSGNVGWKSTGEGEFGGSAFTWAKPGDSVMFRHALTYCNQGVQDDAGYVQTNANWFELKATSINQNYAFGENDFLYNRRIVLTKNDPVPSQIAKADVTSAWGFRVYSPSIEPDAGGTYSCDVGVYRLNPHIEPGYQTHGFTTATGPCNAAGKTGVTDETGQAITQTLEYNINRAYIRHKTKFSPGRMECHDQTNTRPQVTFNIKDYGPDNYHRAVGDGEYPEWGYPDTYDCIYNEWWDTVTVSNPNYQPDPSLPNYDPYQTKPTQVRHNPDHFYTPSEHWTFIGATHNEPGSQMNTVTVKIPYNFETATSSSLSNNPVYGGESVSTRFNWSVLPRSNPVINDSPYATITPGDSKVQVIEFTLKPSYNGSISGAVDGADPCAYYTGLAGSDMIECNPIETIPGPFNPTGDYNGDSSSRAYTRAIPDTDEVGTKYCVAIGMYPNSSHLNPGQSDDEGMGSNYDKRWNIAGASCSVIAKKPNFQTWGAGLYTKGKVNTSVSKKQVGAGFGDYNPNAIFGSWSDFSIVALGEVNGMGSAAGFGYISALQPSVDGANSGAKSSAKLCDVSNLTIAKTTCAEGYAGKSKIRISTTIIDRFRARYTSDDVVAKPSGYVVNQTRVDNEYDRIGSGVRYFKVNGDAIIDGDILMNGGTGVDTLVVHAYNDAGTATVTIRGDICYGDTTCDANWIDDNRIRGGNHSVDGSVAMLYSDVASLPQVLIFADNINIEEQVSQIDGWLIAKKTLNTCSNFVSGSTDADTCAATLTINGPVYAGDIAFNRTAGARGGSGVSEGAEVQYQNLANDGSITPAEIFNLRPDVYYWSYAQAQRYSQAVVTYTRELAPRY